MADTTLPQPPQSENTPSERSFGWWDMFVHPDDDPRSDGGFVGERDTLVGYLRDQRLTLEMKCAGLDAEAMARRSVEPSNMGLFGLGLLGAGAHQAGCGGARPPPPAPRHYRSDGDPGGDFNGAVPDPEVVADAWDTWRSEVAFAERFVDEARDLDITGTHDDEPIALREVLVHLIEEYARHNGHADFLRERIDGRVGQ
ncbi:mycothiol transferase [Streptomyces mirabilis]|uniref:mycothiol transferase n=1 Tax=Streptomyces mirabilis TaxID=68239 RepID=UPI00367C0C81